MGYLTGSPRIPPELCQQKDLLSIDALPYPIVPSFRDWKFPNCLPPLWESYAQQVPPYYEPFSGTTDQKIIVRGRDRSCRLTNSRDCTHVSHIIPVTELDWFTWNIMSHHAIREDFSINSATNRILLRPDIHKLFDQHAWVITPKALGGKAALYCHVLNDRWPDLAPLYHNRKMHPLNGVSVHYLFARFARAIFGTLEIFLVSGVSRRLTIRVKSTGKMETKEYDASELQKLYSTTSSRSRSSTPEQCPSSGSQASEDAVQHEEDAQGSSNGSSSQSSDRASPPIGQPMHSSSPEGPIRKRRRGRSPRLR